MCLIRAIKIILEVYFEYFEKFSLLHFLPRERFDNIVKISEKIIAAGKNRLRIVVKEDIHLETLKILFVNL